MGAHTGSAQVQPLRRWIGDRIIDKHGRPAQSAHHAELVLVDLRTFRRLAICIVRAVTVPKLVHVPAGPPEVFVIEQESAHIHPMPDGGLHVALPLEVAQEAVGKDWAEQHPVARMLQNVVMIYAPRDADEIEVVAGLVVEAYRYLGGAVPDSA